MDEYITLEVPQLNSMGLNDDDPFFDYLRKRYPKLREWGITDPLREGTADIVRGFGTSNMENERLQSLVGLNDQQFIEAVRSKRATREESLLRFLPQEQRDAILKGRIAQRDMWQKGVDSVADYIQPTPHAQPDSWYGNIGYSALKMTPHIAAAIPQIKLLGGLGYAGLNTLTGHQAAQEQVYDNLRAQGLSPDEARQQATAFWPNAADLVIRGATNAAIMHLLGKTPSTIMPKYSPYAQTAQNIAMASGVSGAGAMGEQALTNYRSNTPNDFMELGKTGLTAAGLTGGMGIINAALNWRKLRDLQRDYNNNQVFWKDWNNRGDNGLDASNGSNPRPEDPNGGGSSPSFRIITEDEATAFNEYLSKWNNAATKFGFNAATDEASLDASTRDVWNAVFSGKLKPDEAIALYTESGLRPEASQRIVNGILQTKAQYPDLANVKPETLESLPQPTRQPQTFEFPMDWKDPLYSNPQTRTPTTTQTPVTFAEPPNPPEIVVVPDTPILGTASPTFGNVPALPPYRQTDSAGGIGNLYQDMHTLLGKLNGQTPAQEPAPQDLGTMTQNARTLLERLKGRLPESPAETQPQTPQIPPLGRKLSEDERFGRRLSRYANTLNNAENTPNLIGRLLELGKMLAESPHHLGKSLREDAQYIEELYKSKPDLQPSTPITPLGLEQTPANEQWNDDDYYQSEDRKPKKENLGSMRGFAEPKPDIVRGIPYSGPRSVRGIPDGHPSTSHSTEGLEDILQPPTPLITPLGQRFPANEQWDDDDYYSSSAGDNSKPWQDIPDTHLPDTHQQEHFISLDEILHKHLRNLPKRDDNPEEHDRLIDEAERKQENAKAHNLQLFRQVESPEKLTELLNAIHSPSTIQNLSSASGRMLPYNMPLKQQIASLVLSRFPDYQPARDIMRIPVLRKIPQMSIFAGFSDVKEQDEKEQQEVIDSNIRKLDTLTTKEDIIKAIQTIGKSDIATMAKSLGIRINHNNPAESFATQFLKRRREKNQSQETHIQEANPAQLIRFSGRTPPDERSRLSQHNREALRLLAQGLPENEKDIRHQLEGLSVPTLRGLTDWGTAKTKKADFIEHIMQDLAIQREIPFDAQESNQVANTPTQTTQKKLLPVGQPFIETLDDLGRNKQITNPEAVKIRDLNLQTLNEAQNDDERKSLLDTLSFQQLKDMHDVGAFGANYEAYKRKKDYIDAIIEYWNLQEQRKRKRVKPDSPTQKKVKLSPLGSENPDDVAETNLDILRRAPNDHERKKLLNAQSMTTDDLKRMRAYIMRKHHADMGVQGKRNDIINSIVKFINRDAAQSQQEDSKTEFPTQSLTTSPNAELNPDVSQSNSNPMAETENDSAPVIEYSGSEQKPLWSVRVNQLSFFVRPYDLDTDKFRLWLIYPVGYPDSKELMMFDAHTEEAVFSNMPDEDVKKKSNTPAAVEAIKQTLIDFFHKHNGGTKADEDSKPSKNTTDVIRVQPDSTDNSVLPQKKQELPDNPISRLALRVKKNVLAHKAFTNDDLRTWATEEFGGTLGQGAYTQKQAYDAMEMGINLAIQDLGFYPLKDHDILQDIRDMLEILAVIPTQSNRDPEQIAFQQFSTPPTLAYLVNWLANIGRANIVLEPSAGTGNLAVFAHNAGATLILNDYSNSGLRADILDALGWGKVYRQDALNIGDILAAEVREGKRSENDMPDRVIMNPPFSAAGKQGTANSNQNGFNHVLSALEALQEGGRLVAILGGGRDGTASSVRTWLNHISQNYNVRAIITSGGEAYKKFGTSFSNAIVVIDKSGATPKNSTIQYAFSGNFDNDDNVRRLFQALGEIRNDISDDSGNEPDSDSTPTKPEPTKPTPAPNMPKPKWPADSVEPEAIIDALKKAANDEQRKILLDGLTTDLLNQLRIFLGLPEKIAKKNDLINSIIKAVKGDTSNTNTPQPEQAAIPDAIKNNSALNAIYDYLDRNEDLTLKIDYAIRGAMESGFRDNEQKKRRIQRAIYNTLTEAGLDDDTARKKTVDIFSFVINEKGYDSESQIITASDNANSHGIPNALQEVENILAKLNDASYEELKDTANNLGINTSAIIDDRDEAEAIKAKLRTAIRKAIKARSASEENSTPQGQKNSEPDTINEQDNNTQSQSGHIAKIDVQQKQEDSPEPQPVSIYSDYEPQEHDNIHLFKLAKPHPSKLVETTNMKNVKLPLLTYSPDLPEEVIKSGDLTVSQLEAIAYAGQAFSKMLPFGQRQGFILGDGTGAGKGRTIAGIIRDQLNHNHGNGRAVWFSIKPDLIGDAKRDYEGIGGNPDDIFPLKSVAVAKAIPSDRKGILFSSYSTFITARKVSKKKKANDDEDEALDTVDTGANDEATIDEARLLQVINWLGKDFDGVIVFDECHQINNLKPTNNGWGEILPSKSAVAASRLANALPNARILYVSATAASDPSKLVMFDRAGLWGKDTPFENSIAFAEAMRQGGLNAMEMFARDAKSMGLFVARSLDSSQITYRHVIYHLTPKERDIVDTISRAWRIIDKLRTRTAIATGEDVTQKRASTESIFRAKQLRSYKFLIIALRVPEAIRQAKQYLDEGYSVVFQIDNTYDAEISRQISAMKKNQDLRDITISPVEPLIEFVKEHINVQKFENVKVENPDGSFSIVQKPSVDTSTGQPIISSEALRSKNRLLADLRQISFNMSPVDEIINALGGPDKVAEVTGRKHRLIRQPDGSIIDMEAPPSADSEREAFNNWTEPKQVIRHEGDKKRQYSIIEGGQKRVIIFSSGKGGTGFSLHADKNFKNQQRRVHFPIDLGFGATKAMQSLGRTNRSNQSSAPEYCIVSTDIPGEIRLITSIARELGKMGAITAGERKSTTQGIFSEKDNLNNRIAENAMTSVIHALALPYSAFPEIEDHRDILIQMGLLDEDSPEGEKPKIPALDKVFNRLLLLSLDVQEVIMQRFRMEQEFLLATALQLGQGDVGTEAIHARSVDILQEITLLEDTQRGITTKLLELEYEVRTRIRPFENATRVNHCDQFFTDVYGMIYAAKKNGEYRDGILIRPSFDVVRGKAIQRYTLFTPDFAYSYATNEEKMKGIFSPVTFEQAKSLWEKHSMSIKQYHSEKTFLVSGVMLPIWNHLKELASKRILRIITPDGTAILGREVRPHEVQKIVNTFKVYFQQHKYSAQEVIDKIQKRGTFVRLLNDWKIKYSTVNGEKRLEILNIHWSDASTDLGLLQEIIGSKYRYFIPIGREIDILSKILDTHPALSFEDDLTADDVMDEATTLINSSIPDSAKNYIIHPSFWNFINDPEDNPLIHTSNYPMDTEPQEIRYQKSKVADSSKSMWQQLKDFGKQIWRGRHDIPELADDKGNIDSSLDEAHEWLRELKRKRQATVHETENRLRVALLGLSPDDFDLFQRAMELRDLYETRNSNPNASMPWGLNTITLYDFDATDPVDENYKTIMWHVRKNPRVQEAMKKADTLMEDLRLKLVEAAEKLGMFDVRDRLSRKFYFRHLVLEYYNMQRSGQPHPTFKNPTARGYMKHREGSEKDISSNWILAMGEVFTRMGDDIKILDTLFKLRQKYDIIEDLRRMALEYNMENALAKIMRELQDVPEDLRKSTAEKKLQAALNATQARGMTRLFRLAKKGDLPVGDNQQWAELVARMTEAEQLENLSRDEQQLLSRYIGWLSDLPTVNKARTAARTFLTGIKSRLRSLKKLVGDEYLDWTTLIPDGYSPWSPSDSRLVFSASTTPEYMLKIAMENIDALLGAESSEIGKMIMSGGDKQLWVIPTRLADALDNIGKSQPLGAFGQIMSKMMGAFKQWVTLSPVNGRLVKYNWRNFFGDIESVLQGNPGALYYFKQAAKELTDTMLQGGVATGTLAEFEKRGGGLTTEFMTELERPDRLKHFAHLFEHKKTKNPLKLGIKALREYIYIASTLTNFRESILRYAAFLSYIKLIKDNNGVPPFYGMSNPREVKAVGDNIYDMAFKLANENLGAYDQLSSNMQWLRDNNFMSFISWVEINFTKSVQMYKNIWAGNSYLEWWLKNKGQNFIDGLIGGGSGGDNMPPNNGGGGGGRDEPPNDNNGNNSNDDGDNEFRKLFRRLAKKSAVGALRLAITLAMAAPLWGMLYIWNKLMGADEAGLTPDVTRSPYLYLGRNSWTGENMYLSDLGSAFDFFRTIGAGGLIEGDLRDLFNGRTSFGQLAVNILDGPVSKFASNANPFAKTIIEAAFDKRAFPSALHPTPIRDKGRFVAQSFGLEWYYDWLTGKPHKPFWDFSNSLANSANQDQSAYFFLLSRKKQFEENVLGKSTDVFTMTRRGEALRNAKKAIDLGDKKAFRRFLREYFRAGGSEAGLKASARTMSPLYGLNDDEQSRFIRWLPKDERIILRRAMRYAERMKAYLTW